MSSQLNRPAASRESGFALLVMFGIIASASLGIVLAVQALAPLADNSRRVDRGLVFVEQAARDGFRQRGAFPPTLGGLAAASNGVTLARWRIDPWGSAQELDYGTVGTSLRVRSRGVDGALGTGDDLQATVPVEGLVRVRQRARLRLIRAALARSPYRWSASMSPTDEADMLAALRDYATAKRQWLTADAATRSVLSSQMTAAANTVSTLAAAHSCTPLPPAVTGAGGLMEGLGMPDGKAVDGLGATLISDSTVGVLARGADATGGTDDDM